MARDLKIECKNLKKKYLSAKLAKQVDPLYDDLKKYQEELVNTINNVTIEKLSEEILDVVENPDLIGDDREHSWSREDQERLNQLNVECKKLQPRDEWYWNPPELSNQAIYNEKRLQFCMDEELVHKVVHCKNCLTTSLMVGLDQVNCHDMCYDCLSHQYRNKKYKEEMM